MRMRPLEASLLFVGAALGGCAGLDGRQAPTPSATAMPPPTFPAQPTPFVETCGATCPALEPFGPASDLVIGKGDWVENAVVTFAGGHWYVAASGRRTDAALVQRFTADGAVDGDALRITGGTPQALLALPSNGGQLVLVGSVRPYDRASGYMRSLHRLGLDLKTAEPPQLLRSPSVPLVRVSIEVDAEGDLLWTDLMDRARLLVREARVRLEASPGPAITTRDWWLELDHDATFERVDGRGYFVDGSQGALRIRELLENGAVGAPRVIFAIPPAEGRQLLLSRRIGDRWYVGAHAVKNGPPVRIQALEAGTLSPVGGLIELSWPEGRPSMLLDADRTPLLLGDLHSNVERGRSSLVPVDTTARAACRATTVGVPALPTEHQAIRAIHFNGATAGVVLSAWGPSGTSRVVFTLLRCVAPRG